MSKAAERAVLGCILIHPRLIEQAHLMRLAPRDFEGLENKIIYKVMRSMADKEMHIDPVSLHDLLTEQGRLESSGGSEYIHSLDVDLPDTGHFETYVKAVKAGAVRTLLRQKSLQMKNLSTQDDSLEELAGSAAGMLTEIIEAAHDGTQQSIHIETATDGVIESLQSKSKEYLPTGFDDLDHKIFGLTRGSLYVVAGRPGMGKTALCTNICTFCADEGATVAIFSLEMSAQEIGGRILASESGIPLTKMRQGALSDAEWDKIRMVKSYIDNFKLEIDDSGGIYTIEGLVARARGLHSRRNLDLLLVDYLQLVELGSAKSSRVEEVSVISRRLKRLAKELKIPVIAISQLTRAVEKRTDKRPMLSDLRESGSIEQDADVVLFVFRPGAYKVVDDTKGKSELIVSKNRQGEGGTVYLRWKGELTSFVNEGMIRTATASD